MRNLIKKFSSPVVVAILVTLLVGSGVAVAAYLMAREVPSTVKILGGEAEVFADAECTEILTALNFGELRELESSSPVSFFVRNQGDDDLYLAMSQTGLTALLLLYANEVQVPEDSSLLKLNFAEGSDVSTTLLVGIDDVATTVEVVSLTGFAESGTLWCEDEAMAYTGTRPYVAEVPESWDPTGVEVTAINETPVENTNINPGGDLTAFSDVGVVGVNGELFSYTSRTTNTFVDCTRGAYGTTAATHPVGSLFEQVELTPSSPEVTAAFTGVTRGTEETVATSHAIDTVIETLTDVYTAISPDEIFEVITYIQALEDAARSDKEFSVTILAAGTPF